MNPFKFCLLLMGWGIFGEAAETAFKAEEYLIAGLALALNVACFVVLFNAATENGK